MSKKSPLQDLLSMSGHISIDDGIATMPNGQAIDLRELLAPKVLVIVNGGVAETFAGPGVETFTFDFDNHNDDPENTAIIPARFGHLLDPASDAPVASNDYDLESNSRKNRIAP